MHDHERNYSFFDRICLSIDQVIKTLSNRTTGTSATYPADHIAEAVLDDDERAHAAALMRVNHAGEICAQALYHGQAIVSRSSDLQTKLQQAAIEEGDHLAWCKQRLDELNSHPSYLNPFWYAGSFCIGLVAGMIGDKWSLGFVAETERQVVKHLASHLHLLPEHDQRSYHIIKRMETDEAKHRDEAILLGAKELPDWIKTIMTFTSKVMVNTAYRF